MNILLSVRNKLAQCLPQHTLTSLSVQINLSSWLTQYGYGGQDSTFNDSLFEKDITEAIGFTDGNKPWKDILNAN